MFPTDDHLNNIATDKIYSTTAALKAPILVFPGIYDVDP